MAPEGVVRSAGSAGREYENVLARGSSWWLKAKMVLGMWEKGDEGDEEEGEDSGRGQVRSALAIWCSVALRCASMSLLKSDFRAAERM